jgi:hypothetical protein
MLKRRGDRVSSREAAFALKPRPTTLVAAKAGAEGWDRTGHMGVVRRWTRSANNRPRKAVDQEGGSR